ncbi:threonine-phosphate decarboxylase [uncultured Bacteroides sp.]|uniref:threonine-phosphate decarboxylase n=1 Tax=uncultured Bacteroides sp. TaxID=162156 RepID=UPI0025D1CCDD|nr:threonine-phosphate decarboxylase [uncultured Bacteroides sp.]
MIEGHGDDSYKYNRPITSNFSSNVYSKVDLSDLKAHLCARIEGIGNYPEPEPYTLEARLACRHRLPADAVCVTNGATEAIYLIAQTFRGTNTAILQPTFSEYADACRIHGHRVTSLYQLPSEKEGFLLPKEVRMLWLCNPNNPTGTVVDKAYLTELIKHNSQVCFIIDQSYEYFTLCSLFSPAQAAEFPNVLLLHSMTKRYAVPGLRLGYITGDGGLLKRLRSHRMPWSVNQLAIEAGLHLLEHDVPNPLDVPAYLQETARLRTALESLGGLEIWATETHFMLIRLRFGKASALKEYLAGEHGILIRDASNFDGLDEHFFRIATQTSEENDRLVEAIKQWMMI